MKHNKKRNTAFIYEVLTKELTKAIVEKASDRKNQIVIILKDFFSKDTILAEELSLYQTLLETTNIQSNIAERLVAHTKKARNELDENRIFDAQSRVIAAINKRLGQDVWSSFVSNFKSMASINAVFNSKTSPKQQVLFEQAIIDQMSTAGTPGDPQLKTIDNLTYNSFIKKFNDKFGTLIQEQKELLNHFITSFADDGFELRLYLNEEISRLKGLLSEASQAEPTPLISQKINEVVEYLDGLRKREFADTDMKKLLQTQQLVQELLSHD